MTNEDLLDVDEKKEGLSIQTLQNIRAINLAFALGFVFLGISMRLEKINAGWAISIFFICLIYAFVISLWALLYSFLVRLIAQFFGQKLLWQEAFSIALIIANLHLVLIYLWSL